MSWMSSGFREDLLRTTETRWFEFLPSRNVGREVGVEELVVRKRLLRASEAGAHAGPTAIVLKGH